MGAANVPEAFFVFNCYPEFSQKTTENTSNLF